MQHPCHQRSFLVRFLFARAGRWWDLQVVALEAREVIDLLRVHARLVEMLRSGVALHLSDLVPDVPRLLRMVHGLVQRCLGLFRVCLRNV